MMTHQDELHYVQRQICRSVWTFYRFYISQIIELTAIMFVRIKMYNIHENLDELKILFGVRNNNCLDLVNHIILIGKQVIYLCRSKKIKPAFDIFLNWIKRVAEIEHNIAQRREALDKYYNKWNHLLKWLQSSNTL